MPEARRRRALITAVVAGVLGAGVLLAWLAGAFGTEASNLSPHISAGEARRLTEGAAAPLAPHGEPASVTVGERPTGPRVPRDFVGLSFEATAIPLLAKYGHTGNLAALLRSLGEGVIRIGGVTADQRAAWVPPGTPRPAWASVAITPEDLRGIAALAHRSGWKVLLTVNLGHYDPTAAADEAAAAHAALGALLVGVAIGNEPDRYAREGLRPASWSSAEYLQQVGAYRSAIARAVPGVKIVAPDASSGIPPLPWVSAAAAAHPTLLTDHYYPLSSCGGAKPNLSELASPVVRAHEADILGRLQEIERSSRLPVAIDETGSISCHGEPGVSNSFGAALWAVDWITRAMGAGMAGLHFHDLVTEPGAYSPLVFAPGTAGERGGVHPAADLHANPDWYALLLGAPLAGSIPVATRLTGSRNLSAAAFASEPTIAPSATRARIGPRGKLLVTLVDFDAPSAKPLRVSLRVPPGFTSGSVLRLMAHSSASLAHVQLGGTEVPSSGAWHPRLPLPRLYGGPGSLSLELPASSAVRVTLEAAPHASP
jgi:hypothetical protein